jgi:hypothetical protein
MALGEDGRLEPTILIKADSLALKYLVSSPSCQLLIVRVAGAGTAYGVYVKDDIENPGLIWSLVESREELQVIEIAATGTPCEVFLFNELSASVAHSRQTFDNSVGDVSTVLSNLELCRRDDPESMELALQAFARARERQQELDSMSRYALLDGIESIEWTLYELHYYGNRGVPSMLSLAERNEGSQQEQLGAWLVDNLQPTGVVRGARIPQGVRSRELTDLLISYEFGTFLFESKSLSIFSRPSLPGRAKLVRDLMKHVRGAASQLSGAVRSIRRGLPVTDVAGTDIDLCRAGPAHAIILVPDISSLSGTREFGTGFYHHFMKATDSFLHILDPSDLLRVVQAAEHKAHRSDGSVSRLMCFDYFLMERFKRAAFLTDPSAAEILFRAE